MKRVLRVAAALGFLSAFACGGPSDVDTADTAILALDMDGYMVGNYDQASGVIHLNGMTDDAFARVYGELELRVAGETVDLGEAGAEIYVSPGLEAAATIDVLLNGEAYEQIVLRDPSWIDTLPEDRAQTGFGACVCIEAVTEALPCPV